MHLINIEKIFMNVFSSGIFSFVLCGVLANLRDKMTDGSGLAIFLVKEIFSSWSNENKQVLMYQVVPRINCINELIVLTD